MGDAKRRAAEAQVKNLFDKASDEGRIIELGWRSLRALAVPADAPQVQLDAMRDAFFAGAQHMFISIMTIMDAGVEPTQRDYRRVDLIDQELQSFIAEFSARRMPTSGQA